MLRPEFDEETLTGDHMENPSSTSVNSLRLKSEESRARLKTTAGQLSQALTETSDDIKTTFSPEHLKAEARAYARKKQTSIINAVRTNVTNHPLEALAIGAVVTYPLLGLIKKVPVPLALIGAGLLLARQGTGSTISALSGNHSDDTTEDGLGERLRAGMKEAQQTIASTGSTAAESVTGAAHAAIAGMKSKTNDFAASTTKAARDTGDSLAKLVERNPLVASGVALAVGGFIAACLPASRIEERFLGKSSGVLKDTARKAADGAVRGAKAEASKVVENISDAARDAGLTSQALDQTVDSLADKVASVADRAVDAAIGTKAPKAETENTSDGDENARL